MRSGDTKWGKMTTAFMKGLWPKVKLQHQRLKCYGFGVNVNFAGDTDFCIFFSSSNNNLLGRASYACTFHDEMKYNERWADESQKYVEITSKTMTTTTKPSREKSVWRNDTCECVVYASNNNRQTHNSQWQRAQICSNPNDYGVLFIRVINRVRTDNMNTVFRL